ncbi:oligosaccharide flippase family protein [Patescibacteria group bacterium]|nr:oligosaccharide flippase family protein [Patescibacteria group bacterium]
MISALTSRKIVWSTLVQYFGRLVTIGVGIITIKLVTNYLGADEYGFYAKISEFSLFFTTIANLGIFGNVVRKMSESPTDGKLFTNALFLRLTTALAFFAVGLIYAFIFLPNTGFALGTLFFMGSLLFDHLTTVCTGMLQASYMMGRSVFANVCGRITILLTVFILIQLQTPAFAPLFFLAPLAGSVVNLTLSLAFVRAKIKFVWRLSRALLRMLFLTALPFGIINIINSLYFRFLPSYFTARVLSDAAYSSYNVSLHIAMTAAMLSTFLMFSTLPAFKQALEGRHMQTAKSIYKVISKTLLVAAVLMVGVGSLLAPTAIRILTNKTFIIPEFWFILPLLLTLGAVSFFYDLVLITVFAFEKEIWFLKREFLALALAASVFALSLITKDPGPSTMLIILGAILGELTMVLFGLRLIRKQLD